MSNTINRVVIGMDPHKRSATIEVMTADETVLGGDRFATDADGFAAMRRYVSRYPDRVWAIEGSSGIGHHVAIRLLVHLPLGEGAPSVTSPLAGGSHPRSLDASAHRC